VLLAVQWIRDRYNECLDRASIADMNLEAEEKNASENSSKFEVLCPERLIYERGLEVVNNRFLFFSFLFL